MNDDVNKAGDAPAVEPMDDKPAAPAGDMPAGAGQAGKTDQYGRQMFEVTCSSCGKPAQVPFKPTDGRPVYCRDCYMNQRGGGR